MRETVRWPRDLTSQPLRSSTSQRVLLMSAAYWRCRKTESCTSCGRRCLRLPTRSKRWWPDGAAWKCSTWCPSSRLWVLVWCWAPFACYWSTGFGDGFAANGGRWSERKERQQSEIILLPRHIIMCEINFYAHMIQRTDANIRISYKYSLSICNIYHQI